MTVRQLTSTSTSPSVVQPDSSGPQTASRPMRQQMRQIRRGLSPFQQRHAAHLLHQRICRRSLFQGARHIAFYLPNDGEISTWPLLRHAWRHGKTCYLPVMHPLRPGHLLFVRVEPDTPLYRNRWGIREPRPTAARMRKPQQLDLVLVPLVAFDEHGGRVGMGKGYYDRCFSFRRDSVRPGGFRSGNFRPSNPGKPLLLGVAHEEQKIPGNIQPAPWDVPMDAVVTPQAWYQRPV